MLELQGILNSNSPITSYLIKNEFLIILKYIYLFSNWNLMSLPFVYNYNIYIFDVFN